MFSSTLNVLLYSGWNGCNLKKFMCNVYKKKSPSVLGWNKISKSLLGEEESVRIRRGKCMEWTPFAFTIIRS